MSQKITPVGKILILGIIGAALYGGYTKIIVPRMSGGSTATANSGGSKDAPKFGTVKVDGDQGKLGRPLRVAINPWPGFAGGILANNGMAPNKECIFWKSHNLLVEFQLIDDPTIMQAAFKKGDIDVIWNTTDSVPTSQAGLTIEGQPTQTFMQVDWSRGGDAIVVKPGINKIEDLKGQKGVMIAGTPSETLLRYAFQNSSMDPSDQQRTLSMVSGQGSPNDLVTSFQSDPNVKFIVTWEPNVTVAMKNVPGSKVLTSTKDFPNLVQDIFTARADFIQQNSAAVTDFIAGWLEGTREASKPSNVGNVVSLLKSSMPDFKSVSDDDVRDYLFKVKMADMSDNIRTFGLDGGSPLYATIYDTSKKMYASTIEGNPDVNASVNLSAIKPLYNENKSVAAAPIEPVNFSNPMSRQKAAESAPIMTKRVTVTFNTGTATLDQNAKNYLDANVETLATIAAGTYIRITGNTDSTGNANANRSLSLARARAVVQFLVNRGLSKDRFFAEGKGSDNPIADNATDAGRAKNRRTDVEVLSR